MGQHDAAFPNFVWDDYFWTTSATLPAWRGFQSRGGAYGSVSDSAESDGTVKILFAPEGRGDGPLEPQEVALVQWVIDHQAAIHDATLARVFADYPKLRARLAPFLDKDDLDELMPEVGDAQQLKRRIGVASINVHPISRDGKPYIGVELGCVWDEEHGLGVLLHGDEPLEVGGADTAILLWKARKHAKG